MYRKREREFQYPPGIEKIIEDVIGAGICRTLCSMARRWMNCLRL